MNAPVSMTDAGTSDYARVARVIHYLREHAHEQPSLAECAAQAGLSEFHFQRLFQRWAGISPKRFLQFVALGEAKHELAQGSSLLEASLAAGLSGAGRLHDLFLSIERMTPGQYKAQADGLTVRFSVEPTPFGPALLAALDRGLCGVSFVTDTGQAHAIAELTARWPRATLLRDPRAIRPYAQALCARMRGQQPRPLGVVLKGTPFQLQVWEALLRVPEGAAVGYGALAAELGTPTAARAVGTAVGRNPLAFLIPCHRVIRASRVLGDYHWGADRKLALLGIEHARHAAGRQK
ncbi:methylated-DNA--[protein]-cysteine S-methyltransferase [Paraliomyxa miuraensis]|uniref:methylated-DNA--[protein]-cysteine S-methyltransferase n=1 Tax=Paraliomyxa miuraensis TaxID=376150 RepID=UPI00225197D1|nr:methylated-DNA--[protein]-cysteine S-methyltransferase [Paraliomyxa miuraensis]MCX4241414.1 methylated-DNA--[protein]-cysteine S-methyltransferase [Paraliomyxa miuraensis]